MIRDTLKRYSLRYEISWALVIKLILLLLLWMVFFRAPPYISTQDVAKTLFATPANVAPNR